MLVRCFMIYTLILTLLKYFNEGGYNPLDMSLDKKDVDS